MNEIYMMISILERRKLKSFLRYYETFGVSTCFVSLSHGTAVSDTLNALGLEATEKVMVHSFVTRENWNRLKPGLFNEFDIYAPGNGVVFLVPMSSVGGKRQLNYLTAGQDYEIKGESRLKDTKYELLLVISNTGYSDEIMDAARAAGAGGGTVVRAKGTGAQGAEQFLGVTLASEKEMIYVVVKKEQKNEIMRAIMEQMGLQSRAQAICFSLPVTTTCGIRFREPELPDLPDTGEAEE